MSSQPFMQLYVSDYLSDTLDLTTEQHGAYLLLLMTMWRNEARLPNDTNKLARIARLSPAKFKRVWEEISRFFDVDGDDITNARLAKEFKKAKEKSQVRADAGSAGGKAKALKNKEPDLANATDLLKQGQKSEPDSIGGGGSACAREAENFDPFDGVEDAPVEVKSDQGQSPTFRERILGAIGVDPTSGMTGPTGRMIGTQADMTFAGKWISELGLTEDEVVATVGEVMSAKRDGPPSTFIYFNKAMERLAGAKASPQLNPAEANITVINGARNERPSKSKQRLDAFIAGAVRGHG